MRDINFEKTLGDLRTAWNAFKGVAQLFVWESENYREIMNS